MSQGNQSCLRFSLEESVWFQKGQEVSELISISLDPHITIQDNDLYVTIQGALQLSGEYSCSNDANSDEENPFSTPKFVQHVEEREEGTYEFAHRFPVDISIPHNRIQRIDDINVEVETFDYVFPERSLMKLTADIIITGLSEEESQDINEQQSVTFNEEEYVHGRSDDESEQENYETEWNQIPVQYEQTEAPSPITEDWQSPFEVVARKRPEDPQQNTSTEEKLDETVPIMVINNNQENPFDRLRYEEKAKAPTEVEVHIEEESIESESSSSESSSENKMMKKLFKKKKKTLTLSEFFARKEEQEDLTRLKVCIVQQGETIDQLAERYDVPVQQLLRVNHLELNKDIFEGQVLYIPTAVARN